MLFPTIIDGFLYLLLFTTVSLIAYKSIQFWAPGFMGRPSREELLSMEESVFNSHLQRLSKGLTSLSVIVSVSPFVGLIGTVLHIIEALQKISTTVDTSIIGGPISTALYATLIGLCCAVPASAALAFFNKFLDDLEGSRE